MSLEPAVVNICFKCDNCEFLEWKVSDGAYVKNGTVILSYKNASGEENKLKSPSAGVINIDPEVKKGRVGFQWINN